MHYEELFINIWIATRGILQITAVSNVAASGEGAAPLGPPRAPCGAGGPGGGGVHPLFLQSN
jgi:hypothetical protein